MPILKPQVCITWVLFPCWYHLVYVCTYTIERVLCVLSELSWLWAMETKALNLGFRACVSRPLAALCVSSCGASDLEWRAGRLC